MCSSDLGGGARLPCGMSSLASWAPHERPAHNKFFAQEFLSRYEPPWDEQDDRKSVVQGKSVDLGGGSIIKKKSVYNRVFD